jgi:hypothetical protein
MRQTCVIQNSATISNKMRCIKSRFGDILHLSNQGRIHAAKLGPPFVKAGAVSPRYKYCLPTNGIIPCSRQSSETGVRPSTAMICASLNRPFFIVNLLRYLAEKILLLNTANFRGDYQGSLGGQVRSYTSFIMEKSWAVRRRRGRKRARGSRTPMPVALRPGERWSLDLYPTRLARHVRNSSSSLDDCAFGVISSI